MCNSNNHIIVVIENIIYISIDINYRLRQNTHMEEDRIAAHLRVRACVLMRIYGLASSVKNIKL